MEENNKNVTYNIFMSNGESHIAEFPLSNIPDIRSWLNKHGKFLSIGSHTIINLDYVVEIKEINEDE